MLRSLAVLTMLLLAGCAVSRPEIAADSLPSALPRLAHLDGLKRNVSATFLVSGSDYLESQGTVVPVGSSATLNSTPDKVSWAIYRFAVTTDVQQLDFDWTALPGDTAWIAVADFTAGHWEITKVTFPDDSLPPFTGDLGRFVSPSGYAYVAALSAEGVEFSLDRLFLQLAGPVIDWARSYGTDPITEDLRFVEVNQFGDVYCAGNIWDSASFNDALLMKYDTLGNLAWAKHVASDQQLTVRGAVADDTGGYVILAGYAGDTGDGVNPFLLFRVDSAGALDWANFYNSGGVESAAYLARDGAGGLVAAAFTTAGSGGALLTRFDADGNEMFSITWRDMLNSVNPSYVRASGGAIYAAANRFGAGYVAKFGMDGTPDWQQTWTASGLNYTPQLLEDGSGGIFVGGAMSDALNDVTVFDVMRLDAQGNMAGHFGYETPYSLCFMAGLEYDGAGNLLIGTFSGEQSNEMGLIRMATDGTLLGDFRLVDGLGSTAPFGLGSFAPIAFKDGHFYLAGNISAAVTPSLAPRGGTTHTLPHTPGSVTCGFVPISLTVTAANLTITDVAGAGDPGPDKDSYLVSGQF